MNTRALALLLLVAVLAASSLLWFGGESPEYSHRQTVTGKGEPSENSDAQLLQLPEFSPQNSTPTLEQSPSLAAAAPEAISIAPPARGIRIEFLNAATGKQLESQQVRATITQTSKQTLETFAEMSPEGVVPRDYRQAHDVYYQERGALFTPDRDGWLALPLGLWWVASELDAAGSDRFTPVGTQWQLVLSGSKQPVTFLLAEPHPLQLRVSDQFGAPATGIILRTSQVVTLPLLSEQDEAPQRGQLNERERGLYVGSCLPGQLTIEPASPGWSGSIELSIPAAAELAELAGELHRTQFDASLMLYLDGAPEGTEVRLVNSASSRRQPFRTFLWLTIEPNGVLFGDLGPGQYTLDIRASTGARRGLPRSLWKVDLVQGEQTTARFAFAEDERTLLRGKLEAATVPLDWFTVGLLPTDSGPLATTWTTPYLDSDGRFQLSGFKAGTFDLRIRLGDFGRWFHVEQLTVAAHEAVERTFIFPPNAIPIPMLSEWALPVSERRRRMSQRFDTLQDTTDEPHRLMLIEELTALWLLAWPK